MTWESNQQAIYEGYFRLTGREDEIQHHGIKGQKWGLRRFQNEDGTLTAEGRQRLGYDSMPQAKIQKQLNRTNTKIKVNNFVTKHPILTSTFLMSKKAKEKNAETLQKRKNMLENELGWKKSEKKEEAPVSKKEESGLKEASQNSIKKDDMKNALNELKNNKSYDSADKLADKLQKEHGDFINKAYSDLHKKSMSSNDGVKTFNDWQSSSSKQLLKKMGLEPTKDNLYFLYNFVFTGDD